MNIYRYLNDMSVNCDSTPAFQRRQDLTPETRLWIAFKALMDNRWGTVTQLARRHAISRTFVYMLQGRLSNAVDGVFCPSGSLTEKRTVMGVADPCEQALEFALLLRLEGKCSIPSISAIMKRVGLKNSSEGWISQELNKIGGCLPNTVGLKAGQVLYVCLAADEVYSHTRPLLISVDPISTAILGIELAGSRKKEDWEKHFNKLMEMGVVVVFLTCDEAPGLCSAHESLLQGAVRQPDTFHAISHRLGKWVNSLERSAYSCIAEEYKRERVFASAKTEEVMQDRMDNYFQAREKAGQAIGLYEDYRFYYNWIISNLQVFDKDGNPCNRKDAECNIREALDCMISLPIKQVKKEINTIYNLLDNLLNYLDVAEKTVKRLIYNGVPQQTVQAFSLAWQYEKNEAKAKKPQRRQYFATKKKEQYGQLAAMLGQRFETLKKTIYAELDKIVQSSAMVENVNSIVRAYLNVSRNKVTQEMLNLILFYHNHRTYKAGKRKGEIPIELLTGEKQQKGWLDMLLDIAREKKTLSMAA